MLLLNHLRIILVKFHSHPKAKIIASSLCFYSGLCSYHCMSDIGHEFLNLYNEELQHTHPRTQWYYPTMLSLNLHPNIVAVKTPTHFNVNKTVQNYYQNSGATESSPTPCTVLPRLGQTHSVPARVQS